MRTVVERFPHVLNVIANNARDVARALSQLGKADWLSEDYAFDIALAGDSAQILAQAREIARGADADINVVAVKNRRKKLLIADMDSTVIGCECLDELADFAGFGARVAAITERAMRGEIEFEPALRERVALLQGLPLTVLERVYRERIRLNPGAKELVATMRAHGARTLLVSGGFTYFTRRVAKDAGFDVEQANRLLDDGIVLTGTVEEPVLGRDAKVKALERTVAQYGLSADDVLAVGDGANDLGMIELAGLGVAWHAKPVLAAAAAARIDRADLTGLLYLQGYRDREIVRAE